ncbi:MAG TPA: alanine racemase [Gemmatimonadales bacterium]|nr:alanine racemase [Gemmatimonadales bacterium]
MTKSNPDAPDRAWLDVDLGAIVRNARRIQELFGAPLLPMVKADGYGLGAVPVARALETVDPWGYGVATHDEGARLRAGGITRPVLVFSPLGIDQAGRFRADDLRPVIGDLAALDAWLAAQGGPFHIEIDTGMSRVGFRWHDEALIAALAERLRGAQGWEGIFTHFHSADSDEDATREQADRFSRVVAALDSRPAMVHLSSSAGAQYGNEFGADLARPGIYLYGARAGSLEPEPVAKLCARVLAIRRLRPGDTVSYGAEAEVEADTTIATIGIGYGDGVPRSLGGRGFVEINGVLVPIVGRVTMDMVMLDVEDTPVQLDDTAVLFGGLVSLDDQAGLAGTISYELLTMLTPRVPRRYRNDS